MNTEKKILLSFPCPNCSKLASPSFSKSDLEDVLETGEWNLIMSGAIIVGSRNYNLMRKRIL